MNVSVFGAGNEAKSKTIELGIASKIGRMRSPFCVVVVVVVVMVAMCFTQSIYNLNPVKLISPESWTMSSDQ